MWIVPEEGRTAMEMYDQLIIGGTAASTPVATATPAPASGNYTAPSDQAIFATADSV